MKRTVIISLILMLLLPSCSKSSNSNATMVKPKYHHRWYDRKKDKHTKRTKAIRINR